MRKIKFYEKNIKRNLPKQPDTKDDNPINQTLLGKNFSNKDIYIYDDMKHCFISGTTGSGKTIALCNFIKSATQKNYPLVIVDGKGDMNTNSLYDFIVNLKTDQKKYIINLNDPKSSDKYNPFQNTSPTVVKDMLINLSNWSEEHYKLNTERYLQAIIYLLMKAKIKISFGIIIKYLNIDNFMMLASKLAKSETITKDSYLKFINIAKTSGSIAQDSIARFSTLYESDIGSILNRDGIDIYSATQENAIILFVLNPLLYPELTPRFGNLAIIDSKKAVNYMFFDSMNYKRKFFIFDELSTYANDSLLDLVNKSRSANVSCILASQSLSDLDKVSTTFKEQTIENCNNYLVLRQNSAINAENWANILGTKHSIQVTYQLQQEKNSFDSHETGLGSVKNTQEYIYHPNYIKNQKVGEGIFLSKDMHYHCKLKIHNALE